MHQEPKDSSDPAAFDKDQPGTRSANDKILETLRNTEALSAIGVDFFNQPELESITEAVLAALRDQTETGQVALEEAWSNYDIVVESLVDKAGLEDTTDEHAVDKAYVYGAIHRAMIYKSVGNTVRYFGELKKAEVYAHEEYLDDLQEPLEGELERLLGETTLSLDGLLMQLWSTGLVDPVEQGGIEEEVRNGAGLQDVLGAVYDLLIERGDDPETVFASLGFRL